MFLELNEKEIRCSDDEILILSNFVVLERIKKEKEVTDKRVVKQDSAKFTLENLEKMFNEDDFDELSTSAGKASPEHQNLAVSTQSKSI